MRRATILICSSLVLFTHGSCISVGEKFSSTGRHDIRLGVTTKSEIAALFGEPVLKEVRKSDSVESSIYKWLYIRASSDEARGRELIVEFVSDVVNGVVFQSALKDDSTEFDMSAAAQIRANESREEDVRNLLGRPHVEVLLPSNLLAFTYGNLPEAVAPEGAASAIGYSHLFATVESNLWVRRMHFLLLFVRDGGTIIAVRRIETVS